MFLNKIKLFLLISICLIFFFLTYNDVKSEELKNLSGIAKVIDGDSLKINKKKIRLFGIDAPENKQQCQKIWLTISIISFKKEYPCGEISTKKLKSKIDGKIIKCQIKGKDIYKRYLSECFLGKTNINAWMVKNGFAVSYRKYSKNYVVFENLAKDKKLGLWSGNFDMPWEWRKKN